MYNKHLTYQRVRHPGHQRTTTTVTTAVARGGQSHLVHRQCKEMKHRETLSGRTAAHPNGVFGGLEDHLQGRILGEKSRGEGVYKDTKKATNNCQTWRSKKEDPNNKKNNNSHRGNRTMATVKTNIITCQPRPWPMQWSVHPPYASSLPFSTKTTEAPKTSCTKEECQEECQECLH